MTVLQLSAAEKASFEAQSEVNKAIDSGKNFLLEAGAGAGKTFSLVEALRHVIRSEGGINKYTHRRVACITYTNVAKDEITQRIDGHPKVYCDTIHGFCWQAISTFQKHLREELVVLESWKSRLEDSASIDGQRVSYGLGFRSIDDSEITLHHDDVIALMISLLKFTKFRAILNDRFPIIFVDEYQDSHAELMEAIKAHFFDAAATGPIFGFFGDHWQQIYARTCGRIEHKSLTTLGKHSNFRSASAIVDVLNRMRPDLYQYSNRVDHDSMIKIYHSNSWKGSRLSGPQWNGDLPIEIAHNSLRSVREELAQSGWDFEVGKTKILMLTHRLLANEQGYQDIPAVFSRNESFTNLEDVHVKFLVSVFEPVCQCYQEGRYGAMLEALGSSVPRIHRAGDRGNWRLSMDRLLAIRSTGTVGDVLRQLAEEQHPGLPSDLAERERQLGKANKDGSEITKDLTELEDLLKVPYSQIINFTRFHNDHSVFSTNHGVKGAEFENVLVVIGRGWNLYNFDKMLAWVPTSSNLTEPDRKSFERSRNLFYVACSRPKTRLALLFTQELSQSALSTLGDWFGDQTVGAVPSYTTS